eukprot:414222-Rhodomonas_salina.2
MPNDVHELANQTELEGLPGKPRRNQSEKGASAVQSVRGVRVCAIDSGGARGRTCTLWDRG